MAGLAFESRKVGDELPDRGAEGHSIPSTAPSTLTRPTDPGPPIPPLRADPAVVDMHQRWAQSAGVSASAARSSLRTRLRRLIRRSGIVGTAGPGADPELLGDVIRAVDAVAAHSEVLAARVCALEGLVDELFTVLSEDLVACRAALPPDGAPGQNG